MSSNSAHNMKVFYDGITEYVELIVKDKLETMLREVAEELVSYIDNEAFEPFEYCGGGNGTYPVWTGNLHDATGIGVYIDGRLSSYIPTSKRESHQYFDGEYIFGTERLTAALNEGVNQFSQGVWIVLFSQVPYAYKVNTQGSPWRRGIGYFDELKSYLLNDVFVNLKHVQS